MMRDYRIVSPSLEGILSHSTIDYKDLRRPAELFRVLDGPSSKGGRDRSGKPSSGRAEPLADHEQKLLDQYFHDLHGVFMKKFSHFIVESDTTDDEAVKLQALLQEMIKVKMIIMRERR